MFAPPSWSPRYRTDDLDEANAPQLAYGSLRRTCLGRGRLGMRAARVFLAGAAIGWSTTAIGQLVRANARATLAHIPLRDTVTYASGRRHFDAARSQVVILGSGTEYSVTHSASTPMLAVVADETTLAAELALRGLGRSAAAHAPATVLPGPEVLAELGTILEELRSMSAVDPQSGTAVQLRTRINEWLATALEAEIGRASLRKTSARRLRRAEEWIDANLGEPISLGRLCAVAGLEASALRRSFHKHRGMSPSEWVRMRRMAAARFRLIEADQDVKVIDVMHDCGLTHAGRFSYEYRKRYGESPSATRSRASRNALPTNLR